MKGLQTIIMNLCNFISLNNFIFISVCCFVPAFHTYIRLLFYFFCLSDYHNSFPEELFGFGLCYVTPNNNSHMVLFGV